MQSNKAQHIGSEEKIIAVSLTYILSNADLVDEYYNQPLQLINHTGIPLALPIVVNGYSCLILPDTIKSRFLRKRMDLFKPIPIAEVMRIDSKETNNINIELIFSSTGHAFILTLLKTRKNHFIVVKMKESTV